MSKPLLSFFFALIAFASTAQIALRDTSLTLGEVQIRTSVLDSCPGMANKQGALLLAGSKSEMIQLSKTNSAPALKTGRQVFAKVPGVMVYDMDGAGNQLNIALRGLDPHRGWEFNMRKDGILTNSDLYGYPASHFSVPLESVERIELVRGTAAIQYGAQFGGMINFVSKPIIGDGKVHFENISSIGSWGLNSTYNCVSGRIGKFYYSAAISKKTRDGYRDGEHADSENEALKLEYRQSAKLSLSLEWNRSYYRYKIPGQLNDSMFRANPQMATRSRNYYSPVIQIPAFKLNWKMNTTTEMWFTSSVLLGNRNSVMFDKVATIPDTISSATNQYAKRQVDIDRFFSTTQELKILKSLKIGNMPASLALGAMYMNNNLRRRQQGKGTTGSDYDLSLTEGTFGRDLRFKSASISAYALYQMDLTSKFTLQAGGRYENGKSNLSGRIAYLNDAQVPVQIVHAFPLFSAGFSYKAQRHGKIYGSISQAYRYMVLKDLIPGSIYEKTDPNIHDAKGYTAEFGYKAATKHFRWDINAFLLQYNQRFGTSVITDQNGQYLLYKTNVGNSRSYGLEWLLEYNTAIGKLFELEIFTCGAWMDARYTNASVKNGNKIVSITNNKVESVPEWNLRNGLQLTCFNWSFSASHSYVSETFADPLNTVVPDATGSKGLVPAYTVYDATLGFKYNDHVSFKAGVNNLANQSYFTKRPTMYPGAGIWPSDGRNFYLTVNFRI